MSIRYKGITMTGGPGPAGKDAIVNGQNTLEIVAGENITIEQRGTTLVINATVGGVTMDEVNAAIQEALRQ